MSELYFSVDIESDGKIPGKNSMLSFGCAVFTKDGKMVDTYSANLDTLPNALPDPDTMEWWKGQKEAWEACRKNTRPAEVVMPEFVAWVKKVAGRDSPVFVGYPTGFDFTFMYWYMRAFAGESPFSFSALDIKTLAMGVLNTDFRKTTKKVFPRSWFGKSRHSHVALDDAIEQGELFCNILAEIRRRGRA
jgi:DNA polymerase III alpha subunit (gram-positive type)